MDSSLPAAPHQSSFNKAACEISIIVPARNEEVSIAACLESLTSQTGVAFEIIVVDDDSRDRTREIAQSFAGVKVISANPRPPGWTGKNNAVIAGTQVALGNWLLFTDADTVHLPGSLARALDEAKREQADLLSYSPQQAVVTFSERAVMPVIFAQLAAQYPPKKVREQNSGIVAANGQYILVRRNAYESVGGHAAVATEILEDVALARKFRDAGYVVHFRYGGDVLRTRMYRSWAQLREGWTKNLALLFPHPQRLAVQNLILWIASWSAFAVAITGISTGHFVSIASIAALAVWLWLYRKIRVANFAVVNNLIAIATGPPIFAYLLLRSTRAHAKGKVSWKGRAYSTATPEKNGPAPMRDVGPFPKIGNPTLRTGN